MTAQQLIERLQELTTTKQCVVVERTENEDTGKVHRAYWGLNVVEQEDQIVLNWE